MNRFMYKLRGEIHHQFKYASMNKEIKVEVVAIVQVREDLSYFYIDVITEYRSSTNCKMPT